MFAMDTFNIQKVVNRLVYDAVLTLQVSQAGFVSKKLILKHIKHQMRRSKIEINLDEYINQSLSYMTTKGVLASTGISLYAIRSTIRYQKTGLTAPAATNAALAHPKHGITKKRMIKCAIEANSKPKPHYRPSIMCSGCRSGVQTLVKMSEVLTENLIALNSVEAISDDAIPISKFEVGSQTDLAVELNIEDQQVTLFDEKVITDRPDNV